MSDKYLVWFTFSVLLYALTSVRAEITVNAATPNQISWIAFNSTDNKNCEKNASDPQLLTCDLGNELKLEFTCYTIKSEKRICFDNNMQTNCLNGTKTCYLYNEKSKNETESRSKLTSSKIASVIGALIFTVGIYLGAIYFVCMQKGGTRTRNLPKRSTSTRRSKLERCDALNIEDTFC
ncbi:uncharacterized protein LOC129569176 isoform X2 [Sitodiplosis mosellana]|uniref:uncharacterized protein LOC129569176 isoform X2 n=1 Tax=Sitodiplosis mosellana TaxID=263140 RepID=UPI002444105E|nr:uncharacterized protein LOC129569176 isoform X2 [Sitodiplosis mosellana]